MTAESTKQGRWQNQLHRSHRGKGGGRMPAYWTRERCIAALAAHVAASDGPLPASRAYDQLCKGRELPSQARLSKLFRGCLNAWRAAGAPPDRITDPPDWTEEENDRLVLLAGNRTLAQIGKALGRSPGACKRQMYALGIRNREGNGYLSVAEVCRIYGCDNGRVKKLIADGRLRARNVRKVRNWLDIDPADITPEIEAELRRPRVHKPEEEWPHEMVERMIALREEGMTWKAIGGLIGRNYNAASRRYDLAFDRRPRWRTAWYVVKELGGQASGLDVVRVLQGRGHRIQYPDLAGMARAHPDKLAYSNGVLRIVRWTSERVRPNQRKARAA